MGIVKKEQEIHEKIAELKKKLEDFYKLIYHPHYEDGVIKKAGEIKSEHGERKITDILNDSRKKIGDIKNILDEINPEITAVHVGAQAIADQIRDMLIRESVIGKNLRYQSDILTELARIEKTIEGLTGINYPYSELDKRESLNRTVETAVKNIMNAMTELDKAALNTLSNAQQLVLDEEKIKTILRQLKSKR
jgi:hypothetical protein